MRHATIKIFLRENKTVLAVFLCALVLALWLTFRSVSTFLFLHDPANRDGPLRGWMNPRFVVEMYDLPSPVVKDVLNLGETPPRGRRLRDIAAEMGMTMPELTEHVRDAARVYREGMK